MLGYAKTFHLLLPVKSSFKGQKIISDNIRRIKRTNFFSKMIRRSDNTVGLQIATSRQSKSTLKVAPPSSVESDVAVSQ